MSEEILRYAAKKLEALASDYVIAQEKREKAQVKFSNSKVCTTQRWKTESLSLFAAINRRIVSTATMPTKTEVDNSIQKLSKFAKALSPNKEYKGIAKGPFKYRTPKGFDEQLKNIDSSKLVKKAINAAMAKGARRVAGVLETEIDFLEIQTSGGAECTDCSAKAYFSVRAMSKDGSGHKSIATRRASDFNCDEAATQAAQIAIDSDNASGISEGKYDLVLEHLPSANILDSISGAASVFYVESGLSCLAGKIGEKVASQKISMVDDALVDWGINSRRFDDEAVPCKRTSIIDKGILKTYLHNTSTAKKYKTQTTANAGLVSPHPINIIVPPGQKSKEDMISSVKRGILITNVWYTRFQNHATGEFSTIPRDGAFLIENGKVIKPVKGMRISDNVLGMLKRTQEASKDCRPVMSWEIDSPITVPQLLISGVNITKSVE